MPLFTKETTRDVDNIYQAFEGFFSSSIRSVEMDWDDEKHVTITHDLKYIDENNLLEDYFSWLVNAIKDHILNQLSKYNTIQLISFIEKQRININNFSPEKRKRTLFNDYLVENIAWGDESILKGKYPLTEYQKSIVKRAYETYSTAYCLLGKEMEKIFTTFLTVFQKSTIPDNSNNESSQSNPDQQAPRPEKAFIDHLVNIEESKRQPFADKLKKKFSGIRGKELALLLEAMKKENYLLISNRGKKALYRSLTQFLGWDIGSDQAINAGFVKNYGDSIKIERYQLIIKNIYKSIK